jgi:16S rRNA (adenine1518-N6/adenine1519-N6)-dimethyltransferase
VNGHPVLNVRALLKRRGHSPRRGLGQNFLEDPAALQSIVAAARLNGDDVVLEIGCGVGSLTVLLALSAGQVVAVELDPDLAVMAGEVLAPYRNVRIVRGDILAFSPATLGLPPGYVVAANIPYNLTSPILRHLLESNPMPQRIVLTVQKEVAQRVCAVPPHMSVLALSVQVYGTVELVLEVPATAFYPIPKVDSAVVRIETHTTPIIAPQLLPAFFGLVKAGFSQRRKTLRNTFAHGLGISPDESKVLLARAGIDPQRRAETLSLDEWSLLTTQERSRFS